VFTRMTGIDRKFDFYTGFAESVAT